MLFKFHSVMCAFLALFFFLFLLGHPTFAGRGKQEVVVIINENSPLPSEMTLKQIKNIYTGSMESEKGVRLLPVDQKNKEIFEEFLAKFIGMTPTAYKNYWVKKLFAEGATAPKVVEGSAVIIKYVAENIGGIGYVWKSDLAGEEKGINTVRISP